MSTACKRTIPGPAPHFVGIESTVQHLHDVLAQYGQRLPTIEGAGRCEEEPLASPMASDDEILVRGDGGPVARSVSRLRVLGMLVRARPEI